MANFEAKNTIKLRKKTPKGQMVPISRVYPPKYHLMRKILCGDGAWLAVPFRTLRIN